MWRLVRRTVCGTCVLLVVVAARGMTPQDSQRLTPNRVKWPTTGSTLIGASDLAGTQTVTLKGDPNAK
jgi:hypothetical protein